jgi:outer membrane protein assembly factor BamB
MSYVFRAVMVGVLAVGLAPSAATAAPSSDWAQDGFGPGNTGVNPSERTITTRNAGDLRYRWSVLSGITRGSCMAQSPPVIAGRRMFLPDQNGVAAYDAVTGQRLWRRHPETADVETPKLAVAGNLLLSAANSCGSVSDPDGELTAFDVATGEIRWSVERDAPMYTMVVDHNVIAIGGGDAGEDRVTVYRRSDGKQLWTMAEVEFVADVSANGRLLLNRTGDTDGSLAVDIVTGKQLWATKADWKVAAADPSGEKFIVGDTTGKLFALNAKNGNTIWSANGVTQQDGTASIAVDDTRVYATREDHLMALNLSDGKKVWEPDWFGGNFGRPTVAGGVLYVPVENGYLNVRDVRTGNDLENMPIVNDVREHAVVAGGRLYVTNGRVLDVFTP